jgi:adenylate kinase
VPDSVVIPLVEQRLKQSDCRVNGWIMDGFPQSDPQINLLKSLKIRPSLVCMFEQPEEESIRRISNRRIDPTTGIYYNLEVFPPKDEATASRLIELLEDKERVVRQRFSIWNQQISNIEEAFKSQLLNVQSDKPVDHITDLICDAIQNPIF